MRYEIDSINICPDCNFLGVLINIYESHKEDFNELFDQNCISCLDKNKILSEEARKQIKSYKELLRRDGEIKMIDYRVNTLKERKY